MQKLSQQLDGSKGREIAVLRRARDVLDKTVRALASRSAASGATEVLAGAREQAKNHRLWASYLVLVVLPSLVYLVYMAAFETRAYQSEIRITVLAAEKQNASVASTATSVLKNLASSTSSDTSRDSHIVLNYVKSRAIIEDLGGRAYVEKFFSKPEIDHFSRLPPGETMEEVLDYWRSRVSASVDTISGILTVKVAAYDPEEAKTIAADIDRCGEKLINDVSLRSRRDALDTSAGEVVRARAELAQVREKLLRYRNENQIIDPEARAKSLGDSIAKLTTDKIDAETTLDVLTRTGTTDSPTIRILRSKVETYDQQITNLKSLLTAPRATGTVSSQIADYERLKLEELFAERVYLIAQEANLRARQELYKQQLYLATIVPPLLPEDVAYPKIFESLALLFVSLSLFWAIGALIWATVDDQMD